MIHNVPYRYEISQQQLDGGQITFIDYNAEVKAECMAAAEFLSQIDTTLDFELKCKALADATSSGSGKFLGAKMKGSAVHRATITC